ncbi:MAG TPA: hypothetical protein VGB53_09580 [Rubricoccaceae bacterium]
MTAQLPETLSVSIRTAKSEDLPALGRLGAALVRAHHAFAPDRFIAATSKTEEAYTGFLGSKIDRPNARRARRRAGGTVLGYAYARVEGPD